MPRFVVLEHESPCGRHWDFMLERGPVLATWALSEAPDSPGLIPAEALADHRPAYLDYEGPISGGRGSVTRWDQGEYCMKQEDAAGLVVSLTGNKLIGRATLRRIGEQPARWEFAFVPRSRTVV